MNHLLESYRKAFFLGIFWVFLGVLAVTGCSKKTSNPESSVSVTAESSNSEGNSDEISSGDTVSEKRLPEENEASAEFQIISAASDEKARSGAMDVFSSQMDDAVLDEAIQKDFEAGMKNALELEKTDLEGASRAYQALTADYPNRFEPYHRLALLFEAAKDHEAAIALYEEALRMNPASAVFFNDFGWYLYSISEFERAAVMIQKALTLEAGNPKYLTNMALVSAELGRWEEAFAFFQKVPGAKSAESYSSIAAVQLKQAMNALEKEDIEAGKSKMEMAKENLKKVRSLDPELPAAAELEIWLKELDEALKKFEATDDSENFSSGESDFEEGGE